MCVCVCVSRKKTNSDTIILLLKFLDPGEINNSLVPRGPLLPPRQLLHLKEVRTEIVVMHQRCT